MPSVAEKLRRKERRSTAEPGSAQSGEARPCAQRLPGAANSKRPPEIRTAAWPRGGTGARKQELEGSSPSAGTRRERDSSDEGSLGDDGMLVVCCLIAQSVLEAGEWRGCARLEGSWAMNHNARRFELVTGACRLACSSDGCHTPKKAMAQ